MTTGHSERMLLANMDYEAALSFRAVAQESVKLHERAVELHEAVGDAVPPHAQRLLETARFELKELNRVCLRHAACVLDSALHAEGQDSEWESAVILFDIQNPVVLAA